MTLDLTTFDAMLKDHYAPGEIENLAYDENKAFALIKKKRGKLVGGRKWIQPAGYALVNGGSSTFATANAVTNNQSRHDAFEPTRAKHYRIGKIDNETIEATSTGDIDSFEPAINEIDKCMAAEGNWANFRFYRGRGGYIGRMTNTAFATTLMTVDDPAALWAVSDGDVLKLASTDGTSGATRAGSLTVASVTHPQPNAPATAVITLTGNISAGVAAAAANDYIFLDGDFGLAPAGLADYVPDTDAAALTTLFSYDRSKNNLLGGARVDGTSMSVHELVTDMMSAHFNSAGQKASGSKVIFGHPFTLGTLSKQIDGKWIVMSAAGFEGGKNASIGIAAFEINWMGLTAKIIADRMCPVKRLYLVDIEEWVMFHAGMFPNFLTKRFGNILKVSETTDGWEARTGGYLNYCTRAPWTNVVGLVG